MAYLVASKTLPRYIKRYARIFSFKRLFNIVSVISSMVISWIIRRPVVWGQPFMLMVEPTNYCNLKCPLCPSGNGEMSRRRGNMSIDDFKKMVDELAPKSFMMMMWNQGEPYLNGCFNEMVRYAHDKGIFTFTSTNRHYIRKDSEAESIVKSGLDEIIVSLDGVDQETYQQYRVGGDINKVFDGVKRLVVAKKQLGLETPFINLQFIVMRHNQQDIKHAEQLANDLGVDKFLVKTAQVYSKSDADKFLPSEDSYSRYTETEDGLVVKGQPVRGCKVLWYSTMVNWNGDVAPCCFDKNVDFKMGSAFEKGSFSQIWRGRQYMDFRNTVLRNRASVDMCRNCSEGYRGMFSHVKELRS